MAHDLAILLCCVFHVALATQRELGVYKVDRKAISVSGLSSGSSMASQYHVCHSQHVMGVGMFAGMVYYCAQGDLNVLIEQCMWTSYPLNMTVFTSAVAQYEAEGRIDGTCHLKHDNVYLFLGTLDFAQSQESPHYIKEFYSNYLDPANIKLVDYLEAGHCMPTSHYGYECSANARPYINNCDYNGAYEVLNHIYGDLQAPEEYGVELPGTFYYFNQSDFFDGILATDVYMGELGMVYIPSGCKERTDDDDESSPKCKLHVVFHGCSQYLDFIGDIYVKNTGYNEVAEVNNIIMLYPQGGTPVYTGCWDVLGYLGPDYATSSSPQTQAVCRMVARLAGKKWEDFCSVHSCHDEHGYDHQHHEQGHGYGH